MRQSLSGKNQSDLNLVVSHIQSFDLLTESVKYFSPTFLMVARGGRKKLVKIEDHATNGILHSDENSQRNVKK